MPICRPTGRHGPCRAVTGQAGRAVARPRPKAAAVLEVTPEDLEAEQAAAAPANDGDKGQAPPASARLARRPLPDHLPREAPPAVLYCYSPDRKGEHPRTHWRGSGAPCRLMGMPGSTDSNRVAAWWRQHAGPTCATDSTTCTSPSPPRSPPRRPGVSRLGLRSSTDARSRLRLG